MPEFLQGRREEVAEIFARKGEPLELELHGKKKMLSNLKAL